MRFLSHASICVIPGIMLAACASEPYKEPVATFAEAVNKSNKALVALDNQLTDAHAAVQRARALSGRYRLELKNCDHRASKANPCVLLLYKTDEEGKDIGEPSKLQPDAKLKEIRALLGDIRSYADNLSTILNADTSEKVENAMTKALGSLQKLAENENLREYLNETKAPVKEFGTPIVTTINWVVGKYVETVKLNAVREAIREADPIVYAATRVMIAAEEQGERVMFTNLIETLNVSEDAWRETPSEVNLGKLFVAVKALQRFRIETQSSLFAALADAHRALTDRLADSRKLTWTTAMAKVEEFRSEAETLLAVIDAVTALRKSE